MARRSRFETELEAVGLLALLGMFVVVGSSWADLPERIPTHYGASGLPDAWGGKDSIWLLPGLALLTYGLLSFAKSRPHLINVPFSIDKSRPEVLAILQPFVLATKASVMMVLCILSWRSTDVALGRAAGLGTGYLPLTLVFILLPMLVYLPKLWKLRLS